MSVARALITGTMAVRTVSASECTGRNSMPMPSHRLSSLLPPREQRQLSRSLRELQRCSAVFSITSQLLCHTVHTSIGAVQQPFHFASLFGDGSLQAPCQPVQALRRNR